MKSLFAVVGLALASSLMFGCAADEDGGDIAEGEEDFSQAQIPGVVAISLDTAGRVRTVGAKTKVDAAMRAMSTRNNGPTPRCSFGPATKITFFDKDAKPVATGSMFCFLGTVKLPNGTTKRFSTRPGALDMFEEPLVPADALWGISKIEIERRAGSIGSPLQKTTVTGAAQIGKVVTAYEPDQAIDTNYSGTRCPPTHIVTFKRGNDEAALSSYVCGSGGEDIPVSVTALFTVPHPGAGDADPLVRGGIKVKAREVEAIANQGSSQ
jgi:hypothetical protein